VRGIEKRAVDVDGERCVEGNLGEQASPAADGVDDACMDAVSSDKLARTCGGLTVHRCVVQLNDRLVLNLEQVGGV